MSVTRLPLAVLVLGALSGASATAHAQPSSGAAAAEALFEDGRALMKRGDHARACPKLAESQRLDPAPGTLLALGVCWEAAGRVARAHAAFVAAAELARQEKDEERAEAAAERVAALAGRLPRARARLAGDRQPPAGLTLHSDDTPDPRPLDAPWPVDPGDRVLEVRAPGKQTVRIPFRAEEGRVVEVEVPPLADAPPAPRPAPTAAAPRRRDDGWSAAQTAGAILGGAGLVTMAVGAVFGITALSDASALDELGYDAERSTCPATNLARCTDAYDDATTSGITSSVLLVGGAALAAGGLALVIVGGDDAPEAGALVIAPGAGVLHAVGRF